MRQREVISFSLPPQWARSLKKAVREEGMSLSSFLREAILTRLRQREWKKIRRQGARTAKKFAISPEDLEEIVDEFRT